MKKNQEGKKHLTYNKRKEDNMICLYLMQALPSKKLEGKIK